MSEQSVASEERGPGDSARPLAIRCRGLTKVYPPQSRQSESVRAVDGLDLEVAVGECFGLLGPNGAGKTTTVEILEGLLAPSSGEVEVLGRRWKDSERELRQDIGISLQETRLPEKLSVLETVTLFRSFYATGLEPAEAIARVGLEEKSRSWVGQLSGGQVRRLDLACALVGRPRLLFLDEPTTGLDPGSRRRLWDVIRDLRSEGRSIVLTTHYMEEAERLCDRVAIADHGKIIALGTPRELIARLGGDNIIEFASRGPEKLEREELERLAGVAEAQYDSDHWQIATTELHATLPALLAHTAERRHDLASLSTRSASLEDVFVHLTGRHLIEEDEETPPTAGVAHCGPESPARDDAA